MRWSTAPGTLAAAQANSSAAFSAGLGMIALNRLPQPYHPVFNVERFREKAAQDGYFLCIEAQDGKFDRSGTRAFLLSTGAMEVNDVEL